MNEGFTIPGVALLLGMFAAFAVIGLVIGMVRRRT